MARDVKYIERAIKAAEAELPDNHRAILITVPCDEPQPQIRYISGIPRDDAVGILKKLLFNWGIDDKWMHHD